jgi:hypothetical protein
MTVMKLRGFSLLGAAFCLALPAIGSAQTKLKWQGYTWYVKNAASEGPGPNPWSSTLVWVDAKGFLHMKIAKVNGKWTSSEIWTDRALSFGTYQCQVEGAIDKLDPNIIFSMFSYQGPDNVKEIDIEYAKWGNAAEKNAWWTVYPNDTAGKKGFTGFNLKLDGTYTTSRYTWSKTGVHYWLLGGHQPLDSNTNTLQEWNYQPANAKHQITQTPMPLHFNLWLFQGKAPIDEKPVEIIVHSFAKK